MFFMVAGAFLGFASGISDSTLNNYLNEVFKVSPLQRGWIEFPRELPGLLVVFMAGFLSFLGDVKIAVVANIVGALGLLGIGFFSKSFNILLFWLVLYSVGLHLYLPVSSSIGMSLSRDEDMGRRLGALNSVNTVGTVIGCLAVLLGFGLFRINYRIGFFVAAMAFAVAAILTFRMHLEKPRVAKPRFVFKREYGLFYWLNVLFGARKQVFITFAPWVLIKVFDQKVEVFAVLGIVGAVIGVFFKPLVGKLIDSIGEKYILMGEAFALIFISLGYAYLGQWKEEGIALYVAFGCYIIDQMLMAVGMARSTYIKKIINDPEDLTATLSTGVSLDHVVSMSIPTVGGLVWTLFGYKYVFLGAAVIAALNLISTSFISIKSEKSHLPM